jgi:hypothetical protein
VIETSPTIIELTKALHKAQSSLHGVVKDAKNPHFKNRYATLEAVIDAAKPALQANGFAFTQAPGALVDGALEITTMLMHSSGEWLRSTLHVPLQKKDPQGVGSAITYGSRYALMATLGLPPVDDDAEAATERAHAKPITAPRAGLGAKGYLELTAAFLSDMCFTEHDLKVWWKAEEKNRDKHGIVEGTPEYDQLGQMVKEHRAAIKEKEAA